MSGVMRQSGSRVSARWSSSAGMDRFAYWQATRNMPRSSLHTTPTTLACSVLSDALR